MSSDDTDKDAKAAEGASAPGAADAEASPASEGPSAPAEASAAKATPVPAEADAKTSAEAKAADAAPAAPAAAAKPAAAKESAKDAKPAAAKKEAAPAPAKEASKKEAAKKDADPKAAEQKALDKARKQVPEVREGRAVAGGVLAPKGEKPNREEIIARALEKIRATSSAYEPEAADEMSRRKLLRTTGWVGFTAFMAFLGGCFARFFFPRVLFEPPTTFKAGFPGEYAIGEVSSKYLKTNRVWIVREATGFYAVFARCTHLGCTPVWLEGEQKFKCPCHGSGYTKEAINYEGPAPRPMERCHLSKADDGQLLVDANKRYLYQGPPTRSWEDWGQTGGAFLPA